MILKTTAAKLHNYVTEEQENISEHEGGSESVYLVKSEDLVVCKKKAKERGEHFPHFKCLFISKKYI